MADRITVLDLLRDVVKLTGSSYLSNLPPTQLVDNPYLRKTVVIWSEQFFKYRDDHHQIREEVWRKYLAAAIFQTALDRGLPAAMLLKLSTIPDRMGGLGNPTVN